MDILKKDLAPLSEDAWEEIEERAADVIKTHLSTRKVFKVDGPKGLDYTVIPEGRLDIINSTENNDVKSGLYKVKPLVEARISFALDRWEMDNIARGAADIDLENLEEAAKKIALYEENAIYKGFADGQIQGLDNVVENEVIPFGDDASSIMKGIAQGILVLNEAYVEQPMTLVVGDEGWKKINMDVCGEPLMSRIKKITGGDVVYSPVVDGAYLVPYDHDDLELTIGQDFAIGYEHHDSKIIQLFITESFTFRVLDPAIIVKYSV